MNSGEAIMAFSQSEKIKTGLITVANLLEFLQGLPEEEKRGARKVLALHLRMLGQEVDLAKVVTGHEEWNDVERFVNQATVMLESGIGEEAVENLSRGLSRVTNIAQQSMLFLKDKGFL